MSYFIAALQTVMAGITGLEYESELGKSEG